MKNIITLFGIFLSVCFFGQSKDTLYITIEKQKVNDDTQVFQNALNQKNGKALKIIVKKADYNISNVLSTSRSNTFILFEKGSSVSFTNNKNTGFLIRHNNFTLKNASIKGNGKSAADFYTGYGVLLFGVDNCDISDNAFDRISGNGILILPSSNKGSNNNVVKNNRFTNPVFNITPNGDESAIMMGYSGKNYLHNNNVIERNTITGNNILKVGIGFIGHGNNNIIKNNKISNCVAYGIVSYESDVVGDTMNGTQILSNEIQNIGETGSKTTVKGMGIYLMTSNNAIIADNKIYNTLRNSDRSETLGQGGISVSLSPGTTVSNNLIDGSAMYGIVSDYSFGSNFVNNSIRNIKKSGAYFLSMNDVKVSGNIFENIGEVVIKGYFENTSLPRIKEQLRGDKYKNIDTGNNFTVTNNKFYSDKDILYFEATGKNMSQKYIGNKLNYNTVENNEIIGNSKKQNELIHFRQETSGNNSIQKNRIIK
ncbi:right-handed parallel beta-helix repeat-containing protein [Chryseobacterium oranimense]|uniref:right-handed parallel beta-helix repeat-containing protein n=1 Tax=Chryseobacterium oranimense TaxID=421058 RepID=UPI0021B08A39|nr:right-handed parallel beta-helix repeat-containing protein [Chryseobacterium oranimense]UWX60785.1 right-handed parallel beta-helix repeat-containing protein [Chryseobacterium oranimense]